MRGEGGDVGGAAAVAMIVEETAMIVGKMTMSRRKFISMTRGNCGSSMQPHRLTRGKLRKIVSSLHNVRRREVPCVCIVCLMVCVCVCVIASCAK